MIRYGTLCLLALALHCASAFIIMKDGYFFDNKTQEFWYPHGISYQTYNQPLGQYQSAEQIDYDLRLMSLKNINSIRVDFSPGSINPVTEGVYNWNLIDQIIVAAKKYNIRIFAIIGYEYLPWWAPGSQILKKEGNSVDPGWHTQHPPCPDISGEAVTADTYIFKEKWVSDVMSIENPDCIAYYQSYVQAISGRYKDEDTIVAFIIGNEFGYLGLWSVRQDGYDNHTIGAMQVYLGDQYNNNITALNQVWKSDFTDFTQVQPPNGYEKYSPCWADVVQFRQFSLARAIGKAASALRAVNKNHLISYSKVGMIYATVDWAYAAEDSYMIVNACQDAGAPLSFFALNNYGAIYPGGEIHTGTFGIEWARNTGLPVVYTECGYTTSDQYKIDDNFQGIMLKSFIMEAAFYGVIGVHVFAWDDRDNISPREYGFGVSHPDRTPKASLPWLNEIYAQLDQMDVTLFTSRQPVEYDVGMFWSDSTDQIENKYLANMSGVWGSLTRLGLRLRMINDTQLHNGAWKGLKLLVLPRNERMYAGDLQYIRDVIIPAGVSVYSDMDMPGLTDYHINNSTDFFPLLDDIFGIKPIQVNTYEYQVAEYSFVDPVAQIQVNFQQNLDLNLFNGATFYFGVFKYHKVAVTSGTSMASYNIQTPVANVDNLQHPAVVFKNRDAGQGKSLIAAFNLGSIDCSWPCFTRTWNQHWWWYNALLGSQVMNIQNELTYTGSTMMQVQHYTTADGRIVILAINWNYEAGESVVVTMNRLKGLQIVDILSHTTITSNSNGQFPINLGISLTGLYVAQPAPKPTVYISSYNTTYDIIVNDQAAPVNVSYQAGGLSNLKLTVQLRNNATDTTYAGTVVNGLSGEGNMAVELMMESSVITLSSATDQVQYYYYAFLTDSNNNVITSTKVPVRVTLGVRLTNSPLIAVNQTVTSTVSWEHYGLMRESAFPTLVGIYFSNATQHVDPTHYGKVQAVAKQLESMGFVENTNVHDAMNSILQLSGIQYSIINNLTMIGTNEIGLWFGVVILPGVSVLSDNDTACLNTFLQNTVNGIVVATEGGIGSGNGTRNSEFAASIFGVAPNLSSASNSDTVDIKITNANSPMLRNYTDGSVVTSRRGLQWNQITTGTPYAVTADGTPTYILNQIQGMLGKTLLLNFDITSSTFATQLWNGIIEYMYHQDQILKMRWQLMCGDKVQADGGEVWVASATGTVSFPVVATYVCHNTSTWLGYTYPWDSTSPYANRVAQLSVQTNFPGSGLPPSLIVNSSAGVGYTLLGAAATVCVAVILSVVF